MVDHRPRSVDIHPDVLSAPELDDLSFPGFRAWIELWVYRRQPAAQLSEELLRLGLAERRGEQIRPVSPRMPRGRALVKPTTAWSRKHCAAARERDQGLCRYCRALGRTIDHVVPRSHGGTDDLDNLVTCCRWCNSRKWARTPEQADMPLLPPPGAADA